MFVVASFIYAFPTCLGVPLPSTSSPIPLSNTTALDTELTREWYPSSSTRGTGDLLYSCALTLSLCVYTAIHLNIPTPGESAWKQTLRKAKWVLIGIFAPEVVLYTALQQWRSARRLLNQLNWRDYGSENDKLDMTYCFYATMGGFVLDVSNLHNEYNYLTLTTVGVRYLAENGHFIAISGISIKDKSKADNLAKLLVCLQMTWLIVQCVARKVYGYPISLLELHTFVHAICALFMYVLWINKPQDVRDPTIVDTSLYNDLVAEDNRLKESNGRLTGTFCIRSQNLTSEDVEGAVGNMYLLLIMVVLMLIYGGVHLAAWNFNFPSKVEEVLWKVSCLDLIGMTGVVALLWFAIAEDDDAWLDSSNVCGWVLLVVNATMYIFSRVFIVVEAFLSLRRVPVGVYAVIPWSNLIPHF